MSLLRLIIIVRVSHHLHPLICIHVDIHFGDELGLPINLLPKAPHTSLLRRNIFDHWRHCVAQTICCWAGLANLLKAKHHFGHIDWWRKSFSWFIWISSGTLHWYCQLDTTWTYWNLAQDRLDQDLHLFFQLLQGVLPGHCLVKFPYSHFSEALWHAPGTSTVWGGRHPFNKCLSKTSCTAQLSQMQRAEKEETQTLFKIRQWKLSLQWTI